MFTVTDNTVPYVQCKNFTIYVSTEGVASITASDVTATATDNCDASVGLTLSDYEFTDDEISTASCERTFTVKVTATDDCSNTATCNAQVTVKKRSTKLVYSGATTGQYSDPVSLTATLYDITGGEPGVPLPNRTVKFTIGTQTAYDTYGGFGGGTDAPTGTASASITLTQSPTPAYNVVSCFEGDDTYCKSVTTVGFDILCEDARAYYTGACYASTASPTSGNATVTLSATIKDITAVLGDPAYDPYPGNITLATVTFINRDNNTAIATVPIGIVNVGDNTVGTASYNWNVNIGTPKFSIIYNWNNC